jgi:iron complex transport system substrate-binding protein
MVSKNGLIAIVVVVVVIIAAIGVFAFTGNGNDDGDKEITLIDAKGRSVTINASDRDRIISTNAVPTEIICGLGGSSYLVGASNDVSPYLVDGKIIGLKGDDYPAVILSGFSSGKIADLGGMYYMPVETMLKADPKIIIMGEYGTDDKVYAQLDSLGITYVVTKDESNIEDIYFNINLIGKVIGKESNATELINEMKGVVAKIAAWANSVSKTAPNVAMMMTDTYAVGQSYIQGSPLLDLLGITNAFSSITGKYEEVSKEAILKKDPQIIIYSSLEMGFWTADDPAKECDNYLKALPSDPILKEVSAVKTGKVFAMTGIGSSAMTLTSHGYITGIALTAMFAYHDYLTFDCPQLIGDDYPKYLDKFWEMINA